MPSHSNNTQQFEFQPSIVKKAALGNPSSWINATWTNETVIIFTNNDIFVLSCLFIVILLIEQNKKKSKRNYKTFIVLINE